MAGFERLSVGESTIGRDVGFIGGWPGLYVYSRWYDADDLSALGVADEMVSIAAQTQPLLDALVSKVAPPPLVDSDDPLVGAVERFKRERGYPTPADETNHADRKHFAEVLTEDALPVIALEDLRQIINTKRYGRPGPMAALNSTLTNADAADYDRIIETFRSLLWGEAQVEQRIDEALDDPDRKVVGLGESVMLKLLAITQPDRFVPVFPVSGPKGKRQMLRVLGIDMPEWSTRGEVQVRTNDLLRDRLDPFFPGDPWAMAQFLYWYRRARRCRPDGRPR